MNVFVYVIVFILVLVFVFVFVFAFVMVFIIAVIFVINFWQNANSVKHFLVNVSNNFQMQNIQYTLNK